MRFLGEVGVEVADAAATVSFPVGPVQGRLRFRRLEHSGGATHQPAE